MTASRVLRVLLALWVGVLLVLAFRILEDCRSYGYRASECGWRFVNP